MFANLFDHIAENIEERNGYNLIYMLRFLGDFILYLIKYKKTTKFS